MVILKKYFLFPLLFFAAVEASCQLNYFDYHAKMTEAEDSLIAGREKSAFEIYKKAFTEYDFVFPRDCLIAAQFAYYHGDKDLSLAFLKRGFDWGLMPFHISRCPVFKNSDLTFLRRAEQEYLSGREKYLKKINPDIVEKVLDIRWRDQYYKNINPTYTFTKDGKAVLDTIMSQNMDLIVEITKKYGFPGQKVIGIVHNNILKELGRNAECDMPNRFKNLTDKTPEWYEHVVNMNSFTYISNHVVLPALLHHPCAFQKLGKDVLMDAIKNGFIHPNDYGILYMAERCKCFARYKRTDSVRLQPLCPVVEPFNGGYGIVAGPFGDSIKINENRKRIGMCTMTHSKEFHFFAQKLDIIVRFGMQEMN